MSKHTWATNGYNGWSNYATFRVHNDILNGYQWDEGEDIYVDLLKEIVENCQTLTDLHELIHDLGGDVIIKSMQGVDFRYLKIIA